MAAVGFDWIFFAIVTTWPILALWAAFNPGPPLPLEERNATTIGVRRIP